MTRLLHLLSLALCCGAHSTTQASHCPATEGRRPLVPASLLQLPGGRGAAKAWAFEDAQDRHSDAQVTAEQPAAEQTQQVQQAGQATREETPSQSQLVGGASLMQHTARLQHQAQQEQGQKTQQSQQQLQQQQLLMKTAVRTAAEQRMLQRAVSASSLQPRMGAAFAPELYPSDDEASASLLELGASLGVKASGDMLLTVLVLGILACVAIYFFFGRPNKGDEEEDMMTTKYAPFDDQRIDTGLSPQSGSPGGLGEVPRQDPFATGPDHVAQSFPQQDVTVGPSSNWPSSPTMPVISPQNAAHHVKEPVCC